MTGTGTQSHHPPGVSLEAIATRPGYSRPGLRPASSSRPAHPIAPYPPDAGPEASSPKVRIAVPPTAHAKHPRPRPPTLRTKCARPLPAARRGSKSKPQGSRKHNHPVAPLSAIRRAAKVTGHPHARFERDPFRGFMITSGTNSIPTTPAAWSASATRPVTPMACVPSIIHRS